jgi:biopolymer transport protein ExbD
MIHNGLLSQTRSARSGGGGHGPLSLVPMIDILMILVVYLLVHTADAEMLPNPRNVSMPMSVSDLKPREATVITVSHDTLYVDGEAVAAVADIRSSAEPVIEALRVALAGDGPEDAGPREITVMAEKSLPYPVLRRIEQAFSGLPGV